MKHGVYAHRTSYKTRGTLRLRAQTPAKAAEVRYSLRIFGLLSNPRWLAFIHLCQYHGGDISSKQFMDPDPDIDYYQNLID